MRIALCRQTRQIIAYFVGDRSADSARALREHIPHLTTTDGPPVATSGWRHEEVFPTSALTACCDKSEGETCHVERWNNTLRQRLGRFVRKTLSFSKCDHMHELALRLFIHEYNQQPITY